MKLVFYIINCEVKSIFGDYFIEVVRHWMRKRDIKNERWRIEPKADINGIDDEIIKCDCCCSSSVRLFWKWLCDVYDFDIMHSVNVFYGKEVGISNGRKMMIASNVRIYYKISFDEAKKILKKEKSKITKMIQLELP